MSTTVALELEFSDVIGLPCFYSRETSTETKGKSYDYLHLPQMCKSETTDSSNNIIYAHSPETQLGTFCPEIRLFKILPYCTSSPADYTLSHIHLVLENKYKQSTSVFICVKWKNFLCKNVFPLNFTALKKQKHSVPCQEERGLYSEDSLIFKIIVQICLTISATGVCNNILK